MRLSWFRRHLFQINQVSRQRPVPPHEHPAGRHRQARALRAGGLRRSARRVSVGGGVRAHCRVPGGLLEGNKTSKETDPGPAARLLGNNLHAQSMLPPLPAHCRGGVLCKDYFQSVAAQVIPVFPFIGFSLSIRLHCSRNQITVWDPTLCPVAPQSHLL